MTLDEINQQLTAIVNSGDPTFAGAAQWIGQAVAAAQSGQMSMSELTETMRDMQRQLAVVQDMSQMQYKETLNTIINGVIVLAGAVF